MHKILIITALLAFASFSLAQPTLTPAVQLVVTYPNGHLQFQYGDQVTYTTSVAPVGNGTNPVPSGTVTIFVDGTSQRATCNLLSNPSTNIVCAVNDTMSPIAVGPHNFTSSYSGDQNYIATTSAVSTIRVYAQASLTLVASPTNPSPSQAIVITVTTSLNPSGQPAPTGNITFTQNGNTLGSCAVTSGGCTFTIPANTFSQGTVTVVGQYSGDQIYAPSSGSVTIVVGPAAGTTTTTNANTGVNTNAGSTTTTTNANTGVNTNAGSTTTTNADTTTNTNAAITNAGTTTNTDSNTNAGTNTNTGVNTGATLNTGVAVTGQSSTAFTGTTGSAASVCGSLLVTILAAAMVL